MRNIYRIFIGCIYLLVLFQAGLAFGESNSSGSNAKASCMNHSAMLEVRANVDHILEELELVKDKIKSKPNIVYGIIDKYLVPKADFDVMAQLVLTRYWRGLTDKQKHDFTSEFSNLIIRTYGVAFESYDGETVEYTCPIRHLPGAGNRIEAKTIIHSLHRPDSVIKFRLLQRSEVCQSCKNKYAQCKQIHNNCKAIKGSESNSKEFAECKASYNTCKQDYETCQKSCDVCQDCTKKDASECPSTCDYKWLVYDLIIDNISIIDSYRQIYTSKFRKTKNADSIIAEMHTKNCKDKMFCS